MVTTIRFRFGPIRFLCVYFSVCAGAIYCAGMRSGHEDRDIYFLGQFYFIFISSDSFILFLFFPPGWRLFSFFLWAVNVSEFMVRYILWKYDIFCVWLEEFFLFWQLLSIILRIIIIINHIYSLELWHFLWLVETTIITLFNNNIHYNTNKSYIFFGTVIFFVVGWRILFYFDNSFQ